MAEENIIKPNEEKNPKVALKCGIEIHQQLDTNKLFCNCPSILRNDEPEFIVKRKLHAVAGETGKVDVAAEYETLRDREFVYQGYGTTCLVELDESPPNLINQEALKIALHIAMHLNCEIIPIAQIMRKTVVDGSNTSGFQRTVLIARDGYVETKFGRVGIRTVLLEEDAARIVSNKNENEILNENENEKEKEKAIFKLDRLGIPLVEIATEPDIKSAEQCKEVALFIGDVLRSCNVKRGIGTVRQDVNISIPQHPRIEIKGFQEPKMFVSVIENEIKRQEENLRSGKELKSEVRADNSDGSTRFLRPIPSASRMYPETDLPLLHISRDIINEAKNTIPKLRSDVREDLRGKGLSEEMIKLLSHGDKIEEFSSLLKTINDPNFIAKVLFIFPKEIASHEKIENIDELLNLDIIESVISTVGSGKIGREDVKHVMEEIAKGKSFEEAIKIEKIDLSEVETEIAKIVKEKPGLSIGGYMGLVMAKFKGKINGKEASEILNKLVNK